MARAVHLICWMSNVLSEFLGGAPARLVQALRAARDEGQDLGPGTGAVDLPRPLQVSLEELMGRHAGGDESAFAELYRRLRPSLVGYLRRLCRDLALAEDVAQMAFVKVHRARATYLPGARVAPWVRVIARRVLVDELRARRSRREFLSADGSLPEAWVDDAEQRERTWHLEQVLSELPDQYREAIQLTKLEGLSGDEAARALATTRSAVKLRVHRGYRILRERLLADAA